MRAIVLFSGSKGNCTYISDGETSILVDAGGCLKRIREAIEDLGEKLENIQGIFITHEHIDHIKALYNISKKYDIKIYTSLETARQICTPTKSCSLEDCKRVAMSIMTIKPDKTYDIGTFSVSTFSTPHDAANSLGFVFRSTYDNNSIGYATDIGFVTEQMKVRLKGIKNIVIESNHDISMLKNGPYPEYLKDRILSNYGHLSNSSCADFIKYLAENGSMSFTLAHLSEENNLPSLALESALKAIDGRSGCTIKVASAYSPTEVKIYEEEI